jgi:hypothetical protein
MKTTRALIAVFPILHSLALAQSSGGGPVVVVNPTNPATAVATTVTTVTGGTGFQGVVATVVPPAVVAPTGTAALPETRGETTVTLDIGFGVRFVAPSRVTVPVAEKLRITAPDLGNDITYIWTKNGRAIAGATRNVLTIDSVGSDDAGVYACLFSTPTTLPQSSQILVLGVGPTDRLLNLSTRGNVGAGGDQGLVSGFVVAANSPGKKLILRAVGPSLSLFGVTNGLRQPVLKIYDGSGREYQNGYAYPAVIGGPTYESDLADSLARAGAFPLPTGTRDVVVMMPFVPGTYTAQVTSGDGTTGTVLLEIYEVP